MIGGAMSNAENIDLEEVQNMLRLTAKTSA